MNIILESKITCSQCNLTKLETMPVDACQFFYECTYCKTILRPKKGNCCVFCSYGTVKCPPVQQQSGCCS
ncbi:GDCCVxC domain-containing (seleno)protein [Solimicrobium silvestre]|uniref:GDCCVxC domain-containing (seleno)protein n=1 Tax=Solimicrobium silvestre TaxID=2099400 RepID=UPI000CFCD370